MTLTAILPGFRVVERPACCAVKRRPRGFVDFGTQGSLEFVVGTLAVFGGTGEVGVADEAALAVVLGVDEPARDVIGR